MCAQQTDRRIISLIEKGAATPLSAPSGGTSPLSQNASGNHRASSEAPPTTPSSMAAYPKIREDLITFFNASKELETNLTHERSESRRLAKELDELRTHFQRELQDRAQKAREYSNKEESLRQTLGACHEKEKALIQQLRTIYDQNQRLRNALEMNSQSRTEELRKMTMELHTVKSSLEYFRQNSKRVETHLQETQTRADFFQKESKERIHELKESLRRAESELSRFRGSWEQMVGAERKGTQLSLENEDLKRRLKDAEDSMSRLKESSWQDRIRKEEFEHTVKRERAEKEMVLTHFQSSETKYAEASRELKSLQDIRLSLQNEVRRLTSEATNAHALNEDLMLQMRKLSRELDLFKEKEALATTTPPYVQPMPARAPKIQDYVPGLPDVSGDPMELELGFYEEQGFPIRGGNA